MLKIINITYTYVQRNFDILYQIYTKEGQLSKVLKDSYQYLSNFQPKNT